MSRNFILFVFQLVIYTNGQDVVYNLFEEEPVGYEVGDIVESLGLDGGVSAIYSILGDEITQFEITDVGKLKTTEVIDREAGHCSSYLIDNCQYNIRILIQYSTLPPRIVRILINLNDTNDNDPVFPQPRYELNVSESTAVGTIIPMASAVDADVGVNDIYTYNLVDIFSDMFDLIVTDTVDGPKTVHLEIKRPLDRESQERYTLVLRASDNGNPKREGTTTVDVIVVDVNDNSPVFTQPEYSKYVPEDIPTGYEVLKLHAVDSDVGANSDIEYSFGNSVTSLVKHYFEIDPDQGILRTIAHLDHESNDVFVMIVQAQDKGDNSIPGFTTVIIEVTDVNDNAPAIDIRYSGEITREGNVIYLQESVNSGFFIALLLVSDDDSGDNGLFDITFPPTYGHFNLISDPAAPNEFYFTAGAGIDREKVDEYNLTITATDKAVDVDDRKTTTVQVRIIVEDINDQYPYFTSSNYKFQMPENTDPGYYVESVIAIDNDIGLNSEINYSLVEADGYFIIDPVSGVITAIRSIDREFTASFSFLVSACDKGTPQLCNKTSVEIEILDKNDKTPVFLGSSYEFEIDENQPMESFVGQVTATYEDVGLNGHLKYSLSGPSNDFLIDSFTGEIYSKRSFDRERQQCYLITIVVNDAGLPSNTNRVTAEISIRDINDNAPVITFPTSSNNTFFIPVSAQSNFWITDIKASDPDNGRNGSIEYSIKDSNRNDAFMVLSNGTVMTKQSLTRKWEGVYDLLINISDKAIQRKFSVAKLILVIANKPFSEPLGPEAFFERFNLSVQDYRDIKPADDGGDANWPAIIVVIALGCAAIILFVIFCVIITIKRHKEGKMEETYAGLEGDFFQASNVATDNGKKNPTSQTIVLAEHHADDKTVS